MMRYFAGFLAVCVIVLALWPMLFTTRRSVKKVCISNVKQLVLGNIMYQEDWDGRFPPARIWMDAIGDYTKSELIYRCDEVGANPGLYGYAFNVKLSRSKTQPKARWTSLIRGV